MPYSDYVIFVDESGDHSLTSIDREYPIFVLDFCIFHKHDYANHPIVVERRGKREDGALELAFRRICDGKNYRGKKAGFDIIFADKRINSAGLQLADLTARPIGRYVMAPEQPNRAWDIIERKLHRSSAGHIEGWGLKVFP